jgi:hypothetical protein
MSVNRVCCVAVLALLGSMALASDAFANPYGGPVSGVARVPAYRATVHKIVYNGGEQADFSFHGDGDTTLNVIVRDANGYEVVRTTGPGDRGHISWRPAQTGVFYIYVVNEGGVYNEYRWRAY